MSHETIYRWIWTDKRCGGTLWQHLRGARKQRRKRYGRYDSRGRLAGKKLIGQRPAVVASRGRIGDWEIGTVHGRGKACLVTVVERKTGFVKIGPIQRATKELTLERTVKLLWAERQRVKTITADNGTEFHNYPELESILNTSLFCDATSRLGARHQRKYQWSHPPISAKGHQPEPVHPAAMRSHC
jgi:IS30 family transposase